MSVCEDVGDRLQLLINVAHAEMRIQFPDALEDVVEHVQFFEPPPVEFRRGRPAQLVPNVDRVFCEVKKDDRLIRGEYAVSP